MDRSTVFLIVMIVVMGIGFAFASQLGAAVWMAEMDDLHERAANGDVEFGFQPKAPEREPMKIKDIPVINRAPEKSSGNLAAIVAVAGGAVVLTGGLFVTALMLRAGEEEEVVEETPEEA